MKTKYTKAQERNLMARAEHYRTIDEIRKANTSQGKFEQSFKHYDWHDDFEESQVGSVDNNALALMGRRDFALKSPADIVQYRLDFAYGTGLLARKRPALLAVLLAALAGISWRDLGIPKRTFNHQLKKLENFLAHLS